jgi:large subunit ribosomal protein L24
MRDRILDNIPKHIKERTLRSSLSGELKEKYGRRNVRVVAGDTIKVMRGEYSGIEGKVEKVNTKRGSLAIEGIQREKIRGGNVKVQINTSNVIITNLHLDDEYRQTSLRRIQELDQKNSTKIVEDKETRRGRAFNKRKKKGGRG